MIKRGRGRPKKIINKSEENITSLKEIKTNNDKTDDESDDDSSLSSFHSVVTQFEAKDDDDFLQDLDNEHFEIVDEEDEKRKLKERKEHERLMKIAEREQKRHEKESERMAKLASKGLLNKSNTTNVKKDDDELFSDNPTEILGRDRRETIAKLQQYKSLFPDQLKKFKVKKNATVEELKEYLGEAEIIVNTSSVEQFLTDSILHCIEITEGVSKRSKFNISGCSKALNSNPKFHDLCKMLYVKYKVFSRIPAEYQLIMLISTTAYVMKTKNEMDSNLDFEIPKNDNRFDLNAPMKITTQTNNEGIYPNPPTFTS
jgi:hypothetical protein